MRELKIIKFKKTNAALFILSISAFLIAVLQPFGYSPDYTNYEFFFQQVRIDFLGQLKESRFEPGFIYFSGWLAKIFTSDLLVYGLLVFLSIAVKLFFLKRFSNNAYYIYLACIFYAFKFFPLHELTQLRASLAVSVMMAALYFVQNEKKAVGVALCALAFSFHYSSGILFPFLFLPRLSRNMALGLALAVFSTLYLISHYAVDIASSYFPVFQMYQFSGLGERAINRFSPVFFPEFFMLAFGLYFWKSINDGMRHIIAIQLLGFAILYAFIEFPVVAVRGREFFSVLWTLFIVQASDCKNKIKFPIYIFVVASITLSLYQYSYLVFFGR